MFNKNYNDMIDNYERRRIDPYSRDRKTYNENNYDNANEGIRNNYNMNNMNNGKTSPLKASYDLLVGSSKTKRFQNENLFVDRVSPWHYQYKTDTYDDGGYNNNHQYSISNNYMTKQNNYYNKDQEQYRYKYNGQNNARFKTPDNYYNRNNYDNNFNVENNNQNQMRRKNSDLDVENNNSYRSINDRNRYYLKDPCDYYRGEEVDDGFRHYSPQDNDYHGSKYGGYIYNYYLNAPMRSDKSENWRFPPLYYYKPKYDPEKKIYIK